MKMPRVPQGARGIFVSGHVGLDGTVRGRPGGS